ncbi:MAG TPA: metal-dependent hydrolase [Candidatus Butyricicoccus stercorigallinarum]|nr:metal-dependent hydrolase [Candidatus Butyricicoccus stercorigallinarum]
MLGKTHMAVGVAAGLALLRPQTLPELVIGTGTLAVGAVLSDIDSGTSESHRDADKIIALAGLACFAVAAAEGALHLGIYERLMQSSNALRIVLGAAAFLLLCAFGKEQPHRSFMHSLPALALLTGCVHLMFPLAAPYFAAGFVSHLALDLLNRRDERLLYPLSWGLSFGLCSSKGLVNRALFSAGCAGGAAAFGVLLLRAADLRRLLP